MKDEILLLPLSATVLHLLCQHPTLVSVGFSAEVVQQEPGKATLSVRGACQVHVAPPAPMVAGERELLVSPGTGSERAELGVFSEELLLEL